MLVITAQIRLRACELSDSEAAVNSGRRHYLCGVALPACHTPHFASLSERGELNVGQLVREWFGRDVFAIGFSTYSGTLTAVHSIGRDICIKHHRFVQDVV
jgi:erythromycin esterase